MAKRKRNTNDDDERPAPRKSALARLAANTVSAKGPSKTMPSFDDDDSHGRSDSGGNGSSGEKSLSVVELVQKVLRMAENKDRAELMVLELMREYSFSFSRLKELLRGKVIQLHLFDLHPLIVAIANSLDISFSKVKYVDVAPMVGLDPNVKGDDIPSFNMFRARLPNTIFHKIVDDLQVFSAQYGPMDKHENEEARACYLSAVCSPAPLKSPLLYRKFTANIYVVFQPNCGPIFWSFV